MTLKEKAAFLSGKSEWQTRDFPRLDIPAIFCSDGPNGVRKQAGAGDHLGINPAVPATCFPTAAAMANSWDEELEQRVGVALGEESMEEDVNVLLGPGLNIKRNPLCGRNFEYFSEDPYLSGKMAAAFIRGVQSTGAAACAKHFAVNSQELRRMAMNAVVYERTLREIYLTGFEIAIKEGGAKTVMSSYNEVNGVYANENEHLLKDILRDEWGFDAFKQQLVVAGGFVFAPVPGDHVVDGRRDDQAATGGVGAIEKYLVVDPLVVAGGGVRHINEPAPLEAPLHGGAANTVSFG